MIRLVLVADTHLGFDFPIRPRSDRRRRGQDFFDNFQAVLSYAIESKADLVVHGGDLFFRSKLPKKIVDMTYKMLLDFAASGIDLFIVPGNHERSILPASVFLGHPKIHLFDKPRTYRMEFGTLSGFPCVRNGIRERFPSLLEETGWNDEPADLRLLCLHQAVEGSTVGPSNYTFCYGPDVLPVNLIPEAFTAVLCGHIHRPQVLNASKVPVIYPGSVERTSFAEKDDEMGFYELTFADRLEYRFIGLDTRPMVDLPINNVEDLESKVSDLHRDAIVRIKPGNRFDEGTVKELNVRRLKEILPRTMNYQLSSAFFRRPGR